MALPFFGGGYSYEDVVPLPPCSAFTNDDPCEPLYGIFNHTCLAPLNWSLSVINGSLYLVEDNSCGDTPIGLGVVFLLLIAFFAFSGGGGGAKARDIKTPPPDKAYIKKAHAPHRRRHRPPPPPRALPAAAALVLTAAAAAAPRPCHALPATPSPTLPITASLTPSTYPRPLRPRRMRRALHWSEPEAHGTRGACAGQCVLRARPPRRAPSRARGGWMGLCRGCWTLNAGPSCNIGHQSE